MRIYIDTESLSFTDPTMLIQYSKDNDIILHEIFHEPVIKTINLILSFLEQDLVFYNVTHDSFHLTKTFNILLQLPESKPPDIYEYNEVEKEISTFKYIFKPKGVCDLLLYTKREFQTTMKQHPIQLKIPKVLAKEFLPILEEKLSTLPKILFAKNPCGYQGKPYIRIIPIHEDGKTPITPEEFAKREKGEISFKEHNDFVYLKCAFCPSAALKDVMKYVFNEDTQQLDIPFKRPKSNFYNPHKGDWLYLITSHINMWHTSKKYRKYAEDDVKYLQFLDNYFKYPEPDNESMLAWSIGVQHCIGYKVNLFRAEHYLNSYKKGFSKIYSLCKDLKNLNAPKDVRTFLQDGLDEIEKLLIPNVSKETLEKILSLDFPVLHEKIKRIKLLKRCQQYIRLLERIIEAQRLYVSFNVLGTRTNRQSGGDSINKSGDKINPQGIPKGIIRKVFTFQNLCGGDFSGFEVAIWDARYNDPKLHEQLASGKKIHGIWGEYLYDIPYEQLLLGQETKGSPYNRAKNSFFAGIYGAQPPKIAQVTGLQLDRVKLAYKKFYEDYEKLGESQKFVKEAMTIIRDFKFCPPEKSYAETFLGFKRDFSTEIKIVELLLSLVDDDRLKFLPSKFIYIGKGEKRKETTTIKVLRSAIYSEVFSIESHCQRIYGNFLIQSPGGQICKFLQCRLNDLNQSGIYEEQEYISTFNVHDEILCQSKKPLNETVQEFIEEYKKYVPFLKMKWNKLNDWSEND